MAQLTLTQRGDLKTNPRFQKRLADAALVKANVLVTGPFDGGGAPRAYVLGDYNAEYQKMRRWAKYASDGGLNAAITNFTEHFTTIYGGSVPGVCEDPGSPFDAATNQPSDDQILASSELDIVFKHFAGVQSGDNVRVIEW